MPETLIPPPAGGEEGATAPDPDNAGGKLFERLVGQLDKRDAQLLETLRGEIVASIDERLKSGGDAGVVANRRAITAALRGAAEEAGAHDVELVDRLIGRDAILIDEAGGVSGIDDAIAALKKAKPFLFGPARSTGGTAKTPRPAAARSKSAKDLTPAEWQAEKKRLGVRG